MKKVLKDVFVIELTPKIGVTLIGILSVIYFALNGKVFATAMPLSLLGYKIMYLLGIDTPSILAGTSLPSSILIKTLENPSLILILGFGLGTLLTTLLRGEFKIGKLGSKTHVTMFAIGGFLVGVGVQGIYGANIGEVFGAISMMSLSGWLIIPFICLGIYAMKPIYLKYKDK